MTKKRKMRIYCGRCWKTTFREFANMIDGTEYEANQVNQTLYEDLTTAADVNHTTKTAAVMVLNCSPTDFITVYKPTIPQVVHEVGDRYSKAINGTAIIFHWILDNDFVDIDISSRTAAIIEKRATWIDRNTYVIDFGDKYRKRGHAAADIIDKIGRKEGK